MAYDWLGLDGDNVDSFCEADVPNEEPKEAMNGNGHWATDNGHPPPHWFILDLGATYNITQLRGRSLSEDSDPTNIDVYISTDKVTWGTAVAAGITTWQDTDAWQTIDSTDKSGRYIKIEVNTWEDNTPTYTGLIFGGNPGPPTPNFFVIFDAYGELIPDTGITDCDNPGRIALNTTNYGNELYVQTTNYGDELRQYSTCS